MKTYQHTQRGTLILITMLATALVLAAVCFFAKWQGYWVVPILLLSGWLFHSLTIEITEGELRWRFGPGLIRKRVKLTDIVSAKVVRTNVLEGWGIHLSRFGWLYNVSGFDAVAVAMRNGDRFALGTDEPEMLVAELSRSQLPSR